jgi:hypothetical protein
VGVASEGALFVDSGSVCGVVAGAMVKGFFGVSAVIGCVIALVIFAWQAWGEWLEIDNNK